MMEGIDYETSMSVSTSWDQIKAHNPDTWETAFAEKIFQKAYKTSPLTISLFYPFGLKGEKMFTSKEFTTSCRDVTSNLDFVITSLGPDMDMVLTQIIDVMKSTGVYGKARPEHLKIVEECILYALDETLGEHLDEPVRENWITVIGIISNELKRVLQPSRRASTQ